MASGTSEGKQMSVVLTKGEDGIPAPVWVGGRRDGDKRPEDDFFFQAEDGIRSHA